MHIKKILNDIMIGFLNDINDELNDCRIEEVITQMNILLTFIGGEYIGVIRK